MKAKSILILIATLIIGFAIGFMTNSQLTKRKIQSFVKMGTPEGFKERLFHVIRPDEMQRDEIAPILDKYADKIHEAIKSSREDMKNINQEMIQKLKPHLRDEQIDRLMRAQERMGRGWGDHRRPGPKYEKGERKERR